MKKQILSLAAAAALLCSCSAGKTPGSIPDAVSVPVSAVTSSASGASAGEVRQLKAGNSAVYYLIEQSDGGRLLCYMDYEQAIEVPLCTSPACAHNSETCTAWVPEEESVSSLVCVDEETIAWIQSRADGSQTIEIADATGAGRRVLYTGESGQFLQTLACADDGALYLIQEEVSQNEFGTWLYRTSLDGGEARPVGKFPDPVPEWKGLLGNDLVLYQFDWGDTTDEAQENGCEHRVFLWNPETGEEKTLDTWHSDSGSIGRTLCWSEEKLWWT